MERSGRVRDAFAALGHDAWSCDLESSDTPGNHLQCDARNAAAQQWDLMIAHPVCRYLANSGAKHLYIGGRKENGRDEMRWYCMEQSAKFFRELDQATHIPQRAIENPVMLGVATTIIGRAANQFVHPYHFGDPFQKATGFHLTNLPLLTHDFEKSDYAPGAIKQECWLMSPGPERERRRSDTYPGIARALARQWGGLA